MQYAHDFANLRNLQETYGEPQVNEAEDKNDPLAQEADALREYIKSYIAVEQGHTTAAPNVEPVEVDFDQIIDDLNVAAHSYTSDLDLFYANHLGIDPSYGKHKFAVSNYYSRLAGMQFKD